MGDSLLSLHGQQKLVSALVVGAGHRGYGYAQYALDHPELLQIVAVADPSEFARSRVQQSFSLPPNRLYEEWKLAAEQPKFADFVIIGTPDRQHKEPAVAFAKLGYHVLLEKPMAVTEEDCKEIVSACKASGVMLAVCHVLRYFPNFLKIRELIDAGVIGDVCCIRHTEPVGFWHFAHSFVRGNWRRADESSFSLLAKCCHDVDLIAFWMGKRKCVRVSSFGSLMHFRKEDKPPGAGSSCLDCQLEPGCPYSAKKIYIDRAKNSGNFGWPVSVVTPVPDIEALTEQLQSGPYGRCVYDCDNDVVTNQIVNMQFDNGATASLHMVAFTQKICSRETVISGTKGEITCNHTGPVRVFDFLTNSSSLYDPEAERQCVPANSRLRGHSGADFFLMDAFVKAVAFNDSSFIQSGPEDTLQSHLLVFAAERSRVENRVIDL